MEILGSAHILVAVLAGAVCLLAGWVGEQVVAAWGRRRDRRALIEPATFQASPYSTRPRS